MTEKTHVQTGSIGFLGWLALIFITLKLTGYITWSWWWVLAPLWAPLVVALVIFLVAFIIVFLVNKS